MPLYIPAIANLTGDVTSVGNATSYANTVPVAKGGTGQTTIQTALAALSTWTTSISYAVGQQVTYGTSIYVCIVAHTAGASIAADIALGKWVFDSSITSTSPNLMLTGNNFEDNTVGGWFAVHSTTSNGLPTGAGSGGAIFSTTNGGSAKNSATNAASVSSSSPIDGIYSLNLATTGTSTFGDGYISQSIPVSSAYQAKVLTVKFKYKNVAGAAVFSGTGQGATPSTYGAAVYDVTNNAWLPMAGNFNFTQSTGAGDFVGTVQTASTTSAVQIFIYFAVTPPANSSLFLDNFYVGQQVSPQAPAVSDWVAYTPTFTGLGTVSATVVFSRRVGDSLQVAGRTTAGTSTATPGLISLGYNGTNSNVVADTSKMSTNCICGYGWANNASTTIFGWSIIGPATNLSSVIIAIQTSTIPATTNTTNASTSIGTGFVFEFNFTIPIVGWSSNSVVSSDTDTRIVAARMTGATATITGSYSDITWTTVVSDTHGAMGAISYTIPVTGYYDIIGAIDVGATSLSAAGGFFVGLNTGSVILENKFIFDLNVPENESLDFNYGSVLLNSGTTLKLQVKTTGTVGTPVINSSATTNFLAVKRLSGPAVITATESVNARYNSSVTVISGSLATISWVNKDFDSHNAMSAGTYTIPVSGKYWVSSVIKSGAIFTAGQNVTTELQKNSSVITRTVVFAQAGFTNNLDGIIPGDLISCNAGDTLRIQLSCSGASPSITASSFENYFAIARVGN